MITLTDFVSNFGDVVELNYPTFDTAQILKILKDSKDWRPYNIRKISNRRLGLSLTSLDGGLTGVPDLDSLREYNILNETNYTESDFKIQTSIVKQLPEVENLLNDWSNHLGRSHFLKLQQGGFFPPHRDNGLTLPTPYFRVLVPIAKFNTYEMKFLIEDKVLDLREGRTYFINTTKIHSLFSFTDDCIMIVLNIEANEESIKHLCNRSLIK